MDMQSRVAVTVSIVVAVLWPARALAAPSEQEQQTPIRGDGPDARSMHERQAQEAIEAAHRHAARFEALSAAQQIGLEGEYEINLAIDGYQKAQELRPGESVLLQEEAELLERFEQLRAEASPQGHGMPPELAEELARVRMELDGLQRLQERAAADAQAKAARKAAALTQEVVKVQAQMEAQERAQAENQRKLAALESQREPWSRYDKHNAAILGSGAVAIAGGVSSIGVGLWALRDADRQRDGQLVEFETYIYADEEQLREGLERWYRDRRAAAIGLTVGGAVLAGVGIGLVTWGIWRLRGRSRAPSGRTASMVGPAISPDRVGIAAAIVF